MQKFTIRQATPNDLDAVAKIEKICFPTAEAATREQFQARLSVFADHFWIIQNEEEPVGFINGLVCNDETIRDVMFEDATCHVPQGSWQTIFGLDVLPDYRCKGLAGKLMEHLIAEAKKEGRRGVILTCKESLVHYYQRFGFKNCGVSQSVHGGAVWYDMKLEFL